MSAHRVIDYPDMSLSLAGLPEAVFKLWLKQFLDEHDFVETNPRIRKGVLQINSTDFIAFLGYLEPEQLSEIELKRFMQIAKKEFERLLFNSTALDHRYHYQWCLAAMKNLPIGRRRAKKLLPPVKLRSKRRKKEQEE